MKPSILLAATTLSSIIVRVGATIHEHQSSNWTVGQRVQTSSGPVSGQAAANESEVSQYLGIPFAQAPTGNLRFAPPIQFNGTELIDGSSFVGLYINSTAVAGQRLTLIYTGGFMPC